MARRDVRRYSDSGGGDFPKVGGDEDQVVNTSGADWPGAEMRPRGRTMPTTPPGHPVASRTARMVDAQTGEALDRSLQKATTSAARRAALRETVGQAGPSDKPMLEHLFGLNLPR